MTRMRMRAVLLPANGEGKMSRMANLQAFHTSGSSYHWPFTLSGTIYSFILYGTFNSTKLSRCVVLLKTTPLDG